MHQKYGKVEGKNNFCGVGLMRRKDCRTGECQWLYSKRYDKVWKMNTTVTMDLSRSINGR